MFLRLSLIVIASSLLSSCQHHGGRSLHSHHHKPLAYVGHITDLTESNGGVIARIQNRQTGRVTNTFVKIPDLQNRSTFNFAYMAKGNVLKVAGDEKKVGNRTMIVAREAYTYSPLASFGKAKASNADRVRCQSLGGRIAPAGSRRADHCIQRLSDAGSKCLHHSECLGSCLMPNVAGRGGSGHHGRCAESNVR